MSCGVRVLWWGGGGGGGGVNNVVGLLSMAREHTFGVGWGGCGLTTFMSCGVRVLWWGGGGGVKKRFWPMCGAGVLSACRTSHGSFIPTCLVLSARSDPFILRFACAFMRRDACGRRCINLYSGVGPAKLS